MFSQQWLWITLSSEIYSHDYLSIYSWCSHMEHRACVKCFVSLQFLDLRQSVGLLGWGISLTQGRYLHRTTQTLNKCRQTSMPWMGFKLMIPAFEQAKTFHASDHTAIVIGLQPCSQLKVNQHYRGTCCLLLQGWRMHQARNHHKACSKKSTSASLILSPWRCRWYVLKCWLTFNGLHSNAPKKMGLFS
jgi:hypothetical protein